MASVAALHAVQIAAVHVRPGGQVSEGETGVGAAAGQFGGEIRAHHQPSRCRPCVLSHRWRQ
jgi:hypothetical protein